MTRLFVAIDLPDEIREGLAQLLAELKPCAPDLKWVRPEAMHLTLKFIGNVSDETSPAVQEKLATVQAPESARIELHGLGCFPTLRRPRVFWVGVEANPCVANLAGDIDAGLAPLGIPAEKREFKPHLTLARVGQNGTRHLPALHEAIEERQDSSFGRFETRSFYLIQSRLSPAGAKYTKLSRFDFAEGASHP